MISRDDLPPTPDWSCPVRPEKPAEPTIPPTIELGEN